MDDKSRIKAEQEAREHLAFQSPERRNHMAWGANDVQFHSDKKKTTDLAGYYKTAINSKLKEDVSRRLKGTWENPHTERVSPDTVLTPEQVNTHLTHRGGLSQDDLDAIRQYKFQSHSTNAPLRDEWLHHNGKIWLPGHAIPHIRRMENVTNNPIGDGMVLYRGFGEHFPIHKLGVGEKFDDHGFTGTSTDKRVAGHFGMQFDGHTVIGKIHTTNGTKGHFLDMNGDTPLGREKELLLHRGSTFQVMKHTRHNDGYGGRFHMVHLKHLGHEPMEVDDSKNRYANND